MSLVKMGVVTLFLSDALISGYTTAAAFSILVTQLPVLLGENLTDASVEPGLAVTPRVKNGFYIHMHGNLNIMCGTRLVYCPDIS